MPWFPKGYIYDTSPEPPVTEEFEVPQLPTSKAASPPIQADRWARNGLAPNAALINAMADGANSSMLFRTKEVFNALGAVGNSVLSSYGTGDRDRWRFAFRTGPYSHGLYAKVLMLPPGTLGYDYNTYARLDIRNGAGTLITSDTFVYGASPTGQSLVYTWRHLKEIDKWITGLSPDTVYYGTWFDVDYGRLGAATVLDMQSFFGDFDGHLAQNINAQTNMQDIHREKVATIMRALWRRSGSKLFNWTVDDGTAPRTNATTTEKNLIDGTTTTISASTPGFTFVPTNKHRLSQTTVRCVMHVYAKTSSGTTGIIKLKDSGGTSIATITGGWSTTAAWQSVAFNLPAAVAKYDLHFADVGGGGVEFSVYAVSAWEEET